MSSALKRGKGKPVDEQLAKIRHTLSHLLAAAVLKLYPKVKLGIGPATDEGFYYDFLTDEPFSVNDLKEIEKTMRKMANQGLPMVHTEMTIEEGKKFFGEKGEVLKVELIEDLAAAGETVVSIYTVGDFVDLCKGPHIETTKEVPVPGFKLDRVAGAYWKGDEHNAMLSRIYGLAFNSKEELKEYTDQREEAERRDHRKVGNALDLFVISPEVGKGLPMMTEKGSTLWRVLERYIVDEEIQRGYLHVNTPILGRKYLYETSGHWEHYQDSMYPPINVDGEDYILRPMTCPHHFMLFASRPRSYKDLPIRYAEIAPLYRKERSGELSGLIRVMGFHLADSHIFIEPSSLKDIFREVVQLINDVMKCLGLTEKCWYRASLKDDAKTKYIDDPEGWEISQKALLEICEEMNLDYVVEEGHAAFYGPKLDIQMLTVGGREETLFTNQIDLVMSDRFNLEYIAADGTRKRPWIVHRSSIGCLERTIAFLIEHYDGKFPTWMSPVQTIILPITDSHADFAKSVYERLRKVNLRVEMDLRNETLNRKVREARMNKIPYSCVVGDQEQANDMVMVTNRDTGLKESLPVQTFIDRLLKEDAEKSIPLRCAGVQE